MNKTNNEPHIIETHYIDIYSCVGGEPCHYFCSRCGFDIEMFAALPKNTTKCPHCGITFTAEMTEEWEDLD